MVTEENSGKSEQEPPGGQTPSEAQPTGETPEEQAAKAESYLANWKRAEADLVNYKKKAEQDRQELSSFANAMMVSSLLPVLDDLERAFDTLDSDLAGLTWVEGLKLIYRKLFSTLESQGLTVILTEGETFDPTVHEAAVQVDGEEGKVLGELQKGYRFRDRVIRPAMVKVGNGNESPQTESG